MDQALQLQSAVELPGFGWLAFFGSREIHRGPRPTYEMCFVAVETRPSVDRTYEVSEFIRRLFGNCIGYRCLSDRRYEFTVDLTERVETEEQLRAVLSGLRKRLESVQEWSLLTKG